MDLLAWLRKQLEEAEPDLLREMVKNAGDIARAVTPGGVA